MICSKLGCGKFTLGSFCHKQMELRECLLNTSTISSAKCQHPCEDPAGNDTLNCGLSLKMLGRRLDRIFTRQYSQRAETLSSTNTHLSGVG